MATLQSFEDLECWKACKEVRLFVMAITKKYPIEEKYDLISNMKRAASSSTRNIAEGFGRHHHQENLQFCRISRGSLYEDDYNIGRKLVEKSITILNGYIRYLNSKTNNQQLTTNN